MVTGTKLVAVTGVPLVVSRAAPKYDLTDGCASAIISSPTVGLDLVDFDETFAALKSSGASRSHWAGLLLRYLGKLVHLNLYM
jgi:hypothetical protein